MKTRPPTLHGLLCSLALLLQCLPAWADAPTPETPASKPATSDTGARARHPAAAARKERQPLEVDASTAVRLTPTREIHLPGVMTIQGEDSAALDFTQTRVVSMASNSNVTVYLSDDSDNRIQLPFTNPFIRHNSDLNIEVNKGSNGQPGNFIYLGFNVRRPVQIFVEPPDGSASLGLRLVPKHIPSQTIVVEDLAGITSPELRQANSSNEYVTQVQSLMEVVASDGIPHGYAVVELDLPAMVMNGLMVQTRRKLSSRGADIYVYQVTNPGPAVAILNESEFDGDLVRAVSIYPKPRITAGQSVEVIVLAGKPRAQPLASSDH